MQKRFDATPAALYARVSSDRQDIDLSVAAQLRALREFLDQAESGQIANRYQFRQMPDEAQTHCGDRRIKVQYRANERPPPRLTGTPPRS